MPNLTNIEINIFSLVLLFILFVNVYSPRKDLLPDQRLFIVLLGADALILIFDAIQWGIDGSNGVFMHNLNVVISMLYYMCNALPCLFWCMYVRYQFTMNQKDKIARILLTLPFLFGVVLSVMSCFNGLFFYIDGNNLYHRGDYFWLFLVIISGYLLYALFYTIANRKKVERSVYNSLLIFALPPFIGGFVQALYYGVSLIWPGVALSLLITYIYVQKSQLHTDHLTGLYNRRRLDAYLERSLGELKKAGGIGGIMLDIDGFKTINDTHGHTVGDQALMDVAAILKQSIGNDGFLARYGGDEFVVIINAKELSSVKKAVDTIRQNVASYNREHQSPFNIHLSVGYDIFKNNTVYTREHVLSHIDNLMYYNKKSARKS